MATDPMPAATQPITQISSADLAERVIVVGDPARVDRLAAHLTDARRIAANREYVTVTGTFEGVPVSVTSHGVGAAGAAVCFTELCRAGATHIIRVGTAGGLRPEIVDGHVVVATGAVRDEGITPHLVPLGFPAVADPHVTLGLLDAVANQPGAPVPAHSGVVLTSDLFYPGPALEDKLAMWAAAGCAAVEMELAALLIVASQHDVAAGGVLAIDGNPLAAQDTAMSGYNPFREVVDRAIEVSLVAALRAVIS